VIRWFALSILILSMPVALQAQDSETSVNQDSIYPSRYVYSTRPVQIWDFKAAIGGAITLLPQPLTESPVPAPSIDLRARLGLPLNFMAFGRATSNIATSFVQSGLAWSFVLGDFSAGAGWSAAYMYGNLTFVDGFNTSQHRWLNYPMVTGTARFDEVILTVRIEAELMTSLTKRIETQTIVSSNNVYTGSSVTIAVEQPFWKNTQVLFGTTFSFSSNPYQSWFLYNTFKDRLLSTEFFMAFIL